MLVLGTTCLVHQGSCTLRLSKSACLVEKKRAERISRRLTIKSEKDMPNGFLQDGDHLLKTDTGSMITRIESVFKPKMPRQKAAATLKAARHSFLSAPLNTGDEKALLFSFIKPARESGMPCPVLTVSNNSSDTEGVRREMSSRLQLLHDTLKSVLLTLAPYLLHVKKMSQFTLLCLQYLKQFSQFSVALLISALPSPTNNFLVLLCLACCSLPRR